jgi:hypothetical protein
VAQSNIYSFLLEQGAPPDMIMRLMDQIKNNSKSPGMFQSKAVGMRGNAAGQTAYSARPQGIYGTPPRS